MKGIYSRKRSKIKRKSLKKRRIKGSGNCGSRGRIEPSLAEDMFYFKIRWNSRLNRYLYYHEYDEMMPYLTIELASREEWLANQIEPNELEDVLSLPTCNAMEIINLEIRDLDSEILIVQRERIRNGSYGSSQQNPELLRLERERYKYLAIKNYLERMINADVIDTRPPEPLPLGRYSSSILPDPNTRADEIKQTAAENPDSLFNWGGRKRRKAKRKSIKRKKNYFSKRFM